MTSDIEMVYESGEGDDLVRQYHKNTPSLLILTQYNQDEAKELALELRPEIEGKTIIEIGAGIGLLAMEMAKHAKYVWAVEVDPAWTWVFVRHLYKSKPKNMSWIFGDARDLIDIIHADVAVIVTRSGQEELRKIGQALASKVLMPEPE